MLFTTVNRSLIFLIFFQLCSKTILQQKSLPRFVPSHTFEKEIPFPNHHFLRYPCLISWVYLLTRQAVLRLVAEHSLRRKVRSWKGSISCLAGWIFVFFFSDFFWLLCGFFPKQVYLWGSILEKRDWTRWWARCAVLGADLAVLGALGWAGRVVGALARKAGRKEESRKAGRKEARKAGRKQGRSKEGRKQERRNKKGRKEGRRQGRKAGRKEKGRKLGWVGRGIWPWALGWFGCGVWLCWSGLFAFCAWSTLYMSSSCLHDVFVFIFICISDVYHGAWAKQSLALVNETWFRAIPCSKSVMWSERHEAKGEKRQ